MAGAKLGAFCQPMIKVTALSLAKGSFTRPPLAGNVSQWQCISMGAVLEKLQVDNQGVMLLLQAGLLFSVSSVVDTSVTRMAFYLLD